MRRNYNINKEDIENTEIYKEFLSYMDNIRKINRKEFLEILEKYGFEILIETKKMVGVHTGSIEIWDTYESIIALVKGKTSFNITNDKEIMLDAIKNNVRTYKMVSRTLKNDKNFILNVLNISNEKTWIITVSSKAIRNMCANKDPVKVLESTIAYNDLTKVINKKNKINIVKKNKI